MINGVPLNFYSSKNKLRNAKWSAWKPGNPNNKYNHNTFLDKKRVMMLVKLIMPRAVYATGEDLEDGRYQFNADPARIANFFAKDGWKLCKVRDAKQYLLFEREI